MPKTIQEIAKIAATWWADQIANPKFDNGDSSFTGFMCNHLANKLVKPVAKDMREAFIEALSSAIVTNLEGRRVLPFGVDYGPDRILSDAAKKAGMPENNFPWKTMMWVSKNHVSAALGYAAQETILYANKDYYREQIKGSEEAIERYQKDDAFYYIDDPAKRVKRREEMTNYYIGKIVENKAALELAEE